MSRILVIAEHTHAAGQAVLNPNVAKVVACAVEIAAFASAEIDVLLLNAEASVVEQAATLPVARILTGAIQQNNGAAVAAVLANMLGDYSHALVAGNSFGRDVMPYAAGLSGLPQVTDIMRVDGSHEFARPAYAGNVIETIAVADTIPCLATVRLASFKPVALDGNADKVAITLAADEPTHTTCLEVRASSSDRPDLMTANRVVSGGRGVGGAEGFETINAMADAIGAAVGASRAAVDAGYIGNDHQVGQTSKIIAPEFYLAFGISGAIQHLAGIKDAGTIVAINSNPDAPIFDVADIGLVGDLFDVIPQLIERLKS